MRSRRSRLGYKASIYYIYLFLQAGKMITINVDCKNEYCLIDEIIVNGAVLSFNKLSKLPLLISP